MWSLFMLLFGAWGCSGSENPGLLLHVNVSANAFPQVGELRIAIEATMGQLGMQMQDATHSGVLVHAESGRVDLRFVDGAFPLRSSFEVLLVPTGTMPAQVRLSGSMFQRDGRPIGSASAVDAMLDKGRRTRVDMSFSCLQQDCGPGVTDPQVFDFAQRNPTVRLTGFSADGMAALAMGRFSASDRSRGDVVAGVRGRGVFVFFGQNRAVPSPNLLDRGAADVRILPKSGELIGDVAATGDMDGDDVDELVITAINGNDSMTPAGAGVVYIISGTRLGTQGQIDLATDTTNISRVYGSTSQEQLGTAVAVGDIDSDGRQDLVMGAAGPGALGTGGAADAGRVYVLYGRPTLPGITYTHLSQHDVRVLGQVAGSPIGRALALGKLDADDQADLVIGNFSEGNRGAVYVLRGSSVVGNTQIDLGAAFSGRYLGPSRSLFGWSVCTANVDGMGLPELIIGARGAALVYVLSPDLMSSPVTRDASAGQFELAFSGPTDSLFGQAIAVGNLDGDAPADLLIGAPAANSADGTRMAVGLAYAVRGTTLGTFVQNGARTISLVQEPPALRIYGAASQDNLGNAVLLGNFDVSDALDELIVGAPKAGVNQQGVIGVIENLP